jgi:hypothetical protein
MKTLLLYLIISCQVLGAFGQIRTRHFPKKQPNDTTSFWYNWARKNEQQAGLNKIENSPYSFHFRLSLTGGEIIDVWKQDSSFQGCLTLWVRDNDERQWENPGIYSQSYKFSTNQAAEIGELIRNSGILKLPSEESIDGWLQGFDGEEIVVQYSGDKAYHLKNYWTPSAQRDLPEALLVQQFRRKALELANLPIVKKSFQAAIPFLCYTTDNSFATCRIVSNSEYWDYRREASKYLRQRKKKVN